jgi:antitoxin MazE
MSDSILTLKYWGNSLGVRLPVAVARAAHLQAEQSVRVRVEDGRVVIEPLQPAPLSLAQRLAAFDPALHGGESMQATQALGVEPL